MRYDGGEVLLGLDSDISQMATFPRRRAVVTGASSGIGEGIARRLAADGAHVLLVARDGQALARVRDGIRACGGGASLLALDITDRSAGDQVVSMAEAALGGLDILVNCASATRNEDFFQLTDDQWLQGFEVKVFAAIRLCRASWPLLVKSSGTIINIGGIGARTPTANSPMTGALSSSLMAITKALAGRGIIDGVQVNGINPGVIETPRILARYGKGRDSAEALHRRARQHGAKRAGRPEDVAALVAYMVSPAADLLQGALVDLDGGATKGL